MLSPVRPVAARTGPRILSRVQSVRPENAIVPITINSVQAVTQSCVKNTYSHVQQTGTYIAKATSIRARPVMNRRQLPRDGVQTTCQNVASAVKIYVRTMRSPTHLRAIPSVRTIRPRATSVNRNTQNPPSPMGGVQRVGISVTGSPGKYPMR